MKTASNPGAPVTVLQHSFTSRTSTEAPFANASGTPRAQSETPNTPSSFSVVTQCGLYLPDIISGNCTEPRWPPLDCGITQHSAAVLSHLVLSPPQRNKPSIRRNRLARCARRPFRRPFRNHRVRDRTQVGLALRQLHQKVLAGERRPVLERLVGTHIRPIGLQKPRFYGIGQQR